MPREKQLGPGELGPPWTVLKLLRWTAGYFEDKEVTATPRLDADLLLGHVLGLDRVELYARTDMEVDDEPRRAFRQLVKRRAAGEPVAYLVGHKSFWQLDLKTDERGLIPRPETEVVLEVALELLPDADDDLRVADIGTGTGAIALALAAEREDVTVAATDASAEALELARENAAAQDQTERVAFYHGDLFEALPEEWRPLDMVVANPPYVPEEDRDEVTIEVRDYEPDDALFAGPEGLDVIERLVPAADEWLGPEGWLVVEIGHRQGEAVRQLFDEAGFVDVDIRRDYEGHDRVAVGKSVSE